MQQAICENNLSWPYILALAHLCSGFNPLSLSLVTPLLSAQLETQCVHRHPAALLHGPLFTPTDTTQFFSLTTYNNQNPKHHQMEPGTSLRALYSSYPDWLASPSPGPPKPTHSSSLCQELLPLVKPKPNCLLWNWAGTSLGSTPSSLMLLTSPSTY